MTGSEERLRRLLLGLGAVLVTGLGYAWAVRRLGVGLPCPFRRVTGLLCPGCGVSRMCLALLEGDWPGAWAANPALCLLLLPGTVLLAWRGRGYGKGFPPARWEERTWLVMAAVLLAFGVLRNLC